MCEYKKTLFSLFSADFFPNIFCSHYSCVSGIIVSRVFSPLFFGNDICVNIKKHFLTFFRRFFPQHCEVLDIPYYDEVQILCFSTTSTVEKSSTRSWMKLMARTREQARGGNRRELCLSQQIRYVHSHLLAKIWHMAQFFAAPRECVQQLTSAVAWYIQQGATFISLHFYATTQKRTRGLGVIRHSCKMWAQGQRECSARVVWHQYWDLLGPRENPHVGRILRTMGYLRMYMHWPITIHLCRHNLQTMRNFI